MQLFVTIPLSTSDPRTHFPLRRQRVDRNHRSCRGRRWPARLFPNKGQGELDRAGDGETRVQAMVVIRMSKVHSCRVNRETRRRLFPRLQHRRGGYESPRSKVGSK